MPQVKFQHVFLGLLALSLLSGFVLPRYTSGMVPQVQVLFAPVSVPARRVGAWAQDRFWPERPRDRRPDGDIRAENEGLLDQVVHLREQLKRERERNAGWANLGDELRGLCTPATVVGTDAGGRDSLLLQGGAVSSSAAAGRVAGDMYVLHASGVAGRIEGRAGPAGAQVRLITDRGFRVDVSFTRVITGDGAAARAERVDLPVVVAEGMGEGKMAVRAALKWADVNGKLAAGDTVSVDDATWPAVLKGKQLGRVTSVEPMREHPGFADIRLEPPTNLRNLGEVMVLTKKAVDARGP